MKQNTPVSIMYFSDVLCVWAYAAEVKLDELRRQYGDRVRLEYCFLRLFGDVTSHVNASWGERGGFPAYSRHVKEVAQRFDYLMVHPDIWVRNVPASSVACHLFLKAIQLLETNGEISSVPQTQFSGRSVFEEAIWRVRLAFFRDLRDVATRKCQAEIAQELGLPLDSIWSQIESGAAFAALCADMDAKERHLIEGSPTFLLNNGRQKLYGNVGYRIIDANIQELMSEPGDRASWC